MGKPISSNYIFIGLFDHTWAFHIEYLGSSVFELIRFSNHSLKNARSQRFEAGHFALKSNEYLNQVNVMLQAFFAHVFRPDTGLYFTDVRLAEVEQAEA